MTLRSFRALRAFPGRISSEYKHMPQGDAALTGSVWRTPWIYCLKDGISCTIHSNCFQGFTAGYLCSAPLSSTSNTVVNRSWGMALSRARFTELRDNVLGRPWSRTSCKILASPDWDTCDPPCEEVSTLLDEDMAKRRAICQPCTSAARNTNSTTKAGGSWTAHMRPLPLLRSTEMQVELVPIYVYIYINIYIHK